MMNLKETLIYLHVDEQHWPAILAKAPECADAFGEMIASQLIAEVIPADERERLALAKAEEVWNAGCGQQDLEFPACYRAMVDIVAVCRQCYGLPPLSKENDK